MRNMVLVYNILYTLFLCMGIRSRHLSHKSLTGRQSHLRSGKAKQGKSQKGLTVRARGAFGAFRKSGDEVR